MITLYGIANCDKIRAAKRWLDDHQVEYQFHDYRQAGVPDALDHWLATYGWQTLINRRSTSWRQLSEAQRNDLDNQRAQQLIATTPTLVKRPLLTVGKNVLIGFDEAAWLSALGK